MTDSELRKLSRAELLELLLELRDEADKLVQQNALLQKAVENARSADDELVRMVRSIAGGVAMLCGGRLPQSDSEENDDNGASAAASGDERQQLEFRLGESGEEEENR